MLKDRKDVRKIRTFTMSDNVLELARINAEKLGLTVSSYITYLIKKDK